MSSPDYLGFLASTPSFGETLFSFYFLRHCKNKNKISPAVSPSKPRVTWLFLSTYYRVLRNKNIKKTCNRCTVTVYPDRPWQAPGHLSTAQLPDLNNVRLAMEQNVLDSAIELRICPSLTNQGALNTVCEQLEVCLLPPLSAQDVCRLALVVQHKYLFHGHDASQYLLLHMAHAQTSTFSFATAQPDVQQAPPAVPVHLSLSPRCLMLL